MKDKGFLKEAPDEVLQMFVLLSLTYELSGNHQHAEAIRIIVTENISEAQFPIVEKYVMSEDILMQIELVLPRLWKEYEGWRKRFADYVGEMADALEAQPKTALTFSLN